jgi:superfamily II DNA or RNA helicase
MCINIIVSNLTTVYGLPEDLEQWLRLLCTYNISQFDEEEPNLVLFTKEKDYIQLPRGVYIALEEYCKHNNLKYTLQFDVTNGTPYSFTINPKINYTSGPFHYQGRVVSQLSLNNTCRLEAPCSSGKTAMACLLFAKLGIAPVLFLTHRDRLIKQFTNTVTKVLGIPEEDIGIIKGKKKEIKPVTVGSLMTLGREGFDLNSLKNTFSVVVFDEAHISPALTYRNVLMALAPKYLYGVSATPEHPYNDDLNNLMDGLLGPVNVQVLESEIPGRLKPCTATKETGFSFKYSADSKAQQWYRYKQLNSLYKQITNHRLRNELIIKDVYKLVKKGFKVLLVTKMVSHAKLLSQMCEQVGLKYSFPYKYKPTDEDKEEAKVDHKKLNNDVLEIDNGNIDVLLGTLGLFKEGFDCPRLSALVLADPFSGKNSTMIRQAGGRIQRHYYEKDNAIILDYSDDSFPINLLRNWTTERITALQEYFGSHEILNQKK